RNKKQFLIFNPFLLGGIRPGSSETIFRSQTGNLEGGEEEHFRYKGVGMGGGISSAIIVLKHISIGLDLRYIRFSSTHILSDLQPGYLMNRSIYSVSLKAGFRFGLKE